MWGLFFLLFPFVLRIRKQDAPMDVFRYGVVTVVFAIAFSAGFVMNSAFSLVAIFASAVQFYYFVGIKWSKSYPSDKSALCLVYQIVISGFLFWTAQYTAGLFCFLLLLASSACMGFVAIRHYRRMHIATVSILVFLVRSFVFPSLSICYNLYNGIETKRWFNCRSYHYSSRGLLYELGDEVKGIRHAHRLSSIDIYSGTHIPLRRYSLGETPVRRLKYLPKNVCEGKFNSWLTCWMVILVDLSIILASSSMNLLIHSEAVLPLMPRTSVER